MKKLIFPIIAVALVLSVSSATSKNHVIGSNYKLTDTIDSLKNPDTTSIPIPAPGNPPGILDSTSFSPDKPTPAHPSPTPPPPDPPQPPEGMEKNKQKSL